MALLYQDLTDRIIAAAFAVQSAIGPGFVEKLYEEALVMELVSRDLKVSRQQRVNVFYKRRMIGWHRLDLVIDGLVVVELKTIKTIEPIHLAYLRSYLKASGIPLGLLLNFSTPSVEIRRVIFTLDRSMPDVAARPMACRPNTWRPCF